MNKMIWVIKDMGTNCFVRRDCFKKYDGENLYISYKTFSRECRGFINFETCKGVLEELELKVSNIIGYFRFEALEVNLDEVIFIHREFVCSGRVDNMCVVEIELVV